MLGKVYQGLCDTGNWARRKNTSNMTRWIYSITVMPTKIKRNKNSNLQHTTKNSEGFLFFPGFAGGNRHVESATAWWRTCEFFSMARLREVSLLLIGFLGIVAICHLAAALREKYPSGSPRCQISTNASKKTELSFNLVGFSTFFTRHVTSRWWFQIFLFSPLPGEDSHPDSYFSDGLVQPLTRHVGLVCYPPVNWHSWLENPHFE